MVEMIDDMLSSSGNEREESYRQGLIITDKTKRISNQEALQNQILERYKSKPIAVGKTIGVVTYNSKCQLIKILGSNTCKQQLHLELIRIAGDEVLAENGGFKSIIYKRH